MSSLNYYPPVKEEEVCWTEKEALGLNIVVKEEKEEEDVTVKQEVEGEAVTVKEEEKDVSVKQEEEEDDAVFGVKKEGEITVTLKDEEEETGDLINTSEIRDYRGSSGEPQHHHDADKAEQILSTSEHLQKHQQRPTDDQSHCCSDCGKGEKPDSHSDSGKSPSGEPDPETPKPARQHHCSHCEKSFCWLRNLKLHEKTHTGKKPFQCSQCGKSFTMLANLKRHERIHTGEKPYHCSHCGMSFTQTGHLKSHERIHTGEKPFQCSQCGKSFTKIGQLKEHERIHKGEKPF
uniref:C2H2-type domain-containing protein n=1 Tax=Salmo trutta TaxID=8032 RepID=A0A673WAC3_SALTR